MLIVVAVPQFFVSKFTLTQKKNNKITFVVEREKSTTTMLLRFSGCLTLALVLAAVVSADTDWTADMNPERWRTYSRDLIQLSLKRRLNGNVAKNLIMFLGDGTI